MASQDEEIFEPLMTLMDTDGEAGAALPRR